MSEYLTLLHTKDQQPLRYLIVDDSVFARKSLAHLVEKFGGQVVAEAADGYGAIAEYDRTRPDIVLMDITMPRMEGSEATDCIVRSHPEARIIMVSSVGHKENVFEALRKGARHFVLKPVDPKLLYDSIRHVLGPDLLSADATQDIKP